jgi:hypothetical protein
MAEMFRGTAHRAKVTGMSSLGSVLVMAAGGYLLLLVGVYFGQSHLLYLPDLPTRELSVTPQDIGLAYEDVWLQTEDGVRLHAWYLPAAEARATLLFFHGNAGNISHRLDSLRIFHQLELSVLIFDYRGYGRSAGSPSEEGTRRDALAAWRYLTETRAVPAADLVYFGRSLGAAVASWLATQHPPGALILESAFTSAPDMAADLYWWLPARWLTRFEYATRDYVARARCPLLVVHSPDDEIIPFHHGEAIYAAAREPKELLRLRGSHNEGFLQSGATYTRGLDAFLARGLRR